MIQWRCLWNIELVCLVLQIKLYFYICGKFNIQVSGTASFSPRSNGTGERHNHFITTMLLTICDDVKCSYDTALTWGISAKNHW